MPRAGAYAWSRCWNGTTRSRSSRWSAKSSRRSLLRTSARRRSRGSRRTRRCTSSPQPWRRWRSSKPADGPYSSAFGVTRTYVPKTKACEGSTSVHDGQDIAIPKGTEIHAPMAGTVLLADPDLFYEGGAVFLDLGHGLVSVTMHISRIDVKAGDTVARGQLLGLSGATGRVTGRTCTGRSSSAMSCPMTGGRISGWTRC